MNLKYKFISDKSIRESTGYQDDNKREIFSGDGLWITFNDTPEESFSGFVKKIGPEFYLQRKEFDEPFRLGEIISSFERTDDRDFQVTVLRNETLPKEWWTHHHPDCGTKYRGCHPTDCPKDQYEKTGIWKI